MNTAFDIKTRELLTKDGHVVRFTAPIDFDDYIMDETLNTLNAKFLTDFSIAEISNVDINISNEFGLVVRLRYASNDINDYSYKNVINFTDFDYSLFTSPMIVKAVLSFSIISNFYIYYREIY